MPPTILRYIVSLCAIGMATFAAVADEPSPAGAPAATNPAQADHAVDQTPANQKPADQKPGDQKPGDQNPVDQKAPEQTPATASDANAREAMCLMIESAATAHGLPLEFFARVIWQESRFQPDAIGPVTRSGARAEGVAQFMPGTARERRLLDPFDPVQALPKSAEFLSELRTQFGNLGLAAAAYNSGPRRVQDWLAGSGSMPSETRHYVEAITGTSIEDWRAGKDVADQRARPKGCRELMALLQHAPNPFVAGLEQRVKLVAAAPWGVQLAAGFSRDKALAMYARAIKRLGAVIGDHDPSLLRTILRSRGTSAFYQVRIGADTRMIANDLCGKIHHAGGACIVLRNPGAGG